MVDVFGEVDPEPLDAVDDIEAYDWYEGELVGGIAPVIGATGLLETFMGTEDTPETREKFMATLDG